MSPMRTLTIALSLLTLTACGSSPPASTAKKPAAAASGGGLAEPRLAPRPFTAEQIREAMPAGTEIRYRLEQPGKPAIIVHSVVTAADEATMTMVTRMLGEDGSVVSEDPAQTHRWDDLVKHADFPAENTQQSRGKVEVPAGTYETIDYVVTETVDGAKKVSTFRFATELPGPPVLLTVEQGGAVVQRMTLLSRN